MACPNFKKGLKVAFDLLGVKRASNQLITCQEKRILSSMPFVKGSALWAHVQSKDLLFLEIILFDSCDPSRGP
jgi:hypothetical protein